MFITKKSKNKNEYVQTNTGLWVRNYNQTNVPKQDINQLSNQSDHKLFIKNQNELRTLRLTDIESEIKHYDKCLIISDGLEFDAAVDILPQIPKDTLVIGVNRSLARWKDSGELVKCKMNYFIMNNPYPEATMYFPTKHKYLPKCLVSLRSNTDFVNKYKKFKGNVYQYTPVYDKNFAGDLERSTQLDDYRNPICAAISFAYKLNVGKLGLLCCDYSFTTYQEGSTKIEDGLWTYPPHMVSHGLIEGCLYWFKRQEDKEIDIVNCSKGPKYKEVPTIDMKELVEFFN